VPETLLLVAVVSDGLIEAGVVELPKLVAGLLSPMVPGAGFLVASACPAILVGEGTAVPRDVDLPEPTYFLCRIFYFIFSVLVQDAQSKLGLSNQNPWPQYSWHEHHTRHNLQGRKLLHGALGLSTHRFATTFRTVVRN
jgi:hypothetical protein